MSPHCVEMFTSLLDMLVVKMLAYSVAGCTWEQAIDKFTVYVALKLTCSKTRGTEAAMALTTTAARVIPTGKIGGSFIRNISGEIDNRLWFGIQRPAPNANKKVSTKENISK